MDGLRHHKCSLKLSSCPRMWLWRVTSECYDGAGCYGIHGPRQRACCGYRSTGKRACSSCPAPWHLRPRRLIASTGRWLRRGCSFAIGRCRRSPCGSSSGRLRCCPLSFKHPGCSMQIQTKGKCWPVQMASGHPGCSVHQPIPSWWVIR